MDCSVDLDDDRVRRDHHALFEFKNIAHHQVFGVNVLRLVVSNHSDLSVFLVEKLLPDLNLLFTRFCVESIVKSDHEECH